jgi:hypothetical protein
VAPALLNQEFIPEASTVLGRIVEVERPLELAA